MALIFKRIETKYDTELSVSTVLLTHNKNYYFLVQILRIKNALFWCVYLLK